MRPVVLLAFVALLLAAAVPPGLAAAQAPGGESGRGGPPLTQSMPGGGPAPAEPQLARTGAEPLIVALAGAGLLLCGAGLRLRLRASE